MLKSSTVFYLMSFIGHFHYKFKRNSPQHTTVIWSVETCPWKIIARVIGATWVIQVHTFRNIHNHYVENASFGQPVVKDKNISNDRYIDTSILQIYHIYRWIFWHKILVDQKVINSHEKKKKTHIYIFRSIINILKLFCSRNWYTYIHTYIHIYIYMIFYIKFNYFASIDKKM